MIDLAGIPVIPGDMDALAGHAAVLRGVGGEFASTGQRINSTWQDLGGVYQAPEVAQLLAATAPVQAISAAVGDDLATVAGALSSYSVEVRQIQAELASLRSQAGEFLASVASVQDWTADRGKVERNNALISAVNVQMAAFVDAQRRCANTINALYGGPQYRADDGDGQLRDGQYGYTAEALDAAASEDGALPWGHTEDTDRGLLGDIAAFFGGVGEAAVGFVTGMGALIGLDASTGEWSWATAGSAWAGLGTLVLAAGVYVTPGGMQLDQIVGVPGFERGQLGDTLLAAGKAMIAYDEWGKDPARAAGMSTFNVVSAVLGTKGAGAGLRTVGAAAETSRFTTVSTAGTAMVRAGEAIGRLPTAKDLITSVTHRVPGLHSPHLHDTAPITHHTDTPTPSTHVDLPTSHVRVDLPETTPRPGSVGDALAHTPSTNTDLPARTPDMVAHGHHADLNHYRPLNSNVDSGDHQSHGEDATGPRSPDSSSVDTFPEQLGNQPDGSWVNVEHGTRFELTPEQNAAADVTLDHGSDTHSAGGPHHYQPADPGMGDPIHTTPDDAVDWSTVFGTTDVNAEPALHSRTATAEQARRYIAKFHPDLPDVNADRYWRRVPGSRLNCSRCAYAVANGFANDAPSSALPFTDGPGWGVPNATHYDYARMLGADPADWRKVSSYDDIIKDVRAREEGAHGVVYISRPGVPRTAHVFNVVHDQNGVVFLDGQTGGLGVLEKNVDIMYLPIGG